MLELFNHIMQNVRSFAGVKLFVHSPQSDTDDITMMQLTSEIVAEIEPKFMHQIDVFRPEPRRVWTEVDKDGRAVWRNDFQREWMTRFR